MRETAYDLLQRGRHLLETNNPAQAAFVLERAHKLEPEKKSIIEPLAIALYNFGKHVEAQAHFEHLVDLDPSNSYAHFGLGMCLKKAGDRIRARGHFRLACAMEPESDLYARALARCE